MTKLECPFECGWTTDSEMVSNVELYLHMHEFHFPSVAHYIVRLIKEKEAQAEPSKPKTARALLEFLKNSPDFPDHELADAIIEGLKKEPSIPIAQVIEEFDGLKKDFEKLIDELKKHIEENYIPISKIQEKIREFETAPLEKTNQY